MSASNENVTWSLRFWWTQRWCLSPAESEASSRRDTRKGWAWCFRQMYRRRIEVPSPCPPTIRLKMRIFIFLGTLYRRDQKLLKLWGDIYLWKYLWVQNILLSNIWNRKFSFVWFFPLNIVGLCPSQCGHPLQSCSPSCNEQDFRSKIG